MRVISGSAKGRPLKVPNSGTRPTGDKVREAIFNILGDKVREAFVADLFAGSGGLGIEALSRGAARSLFVDVSPAAVRTIRQNLEHTGLEDRAEVWRGRYPQFLRKMAVSTYTFDLLFSDPPYEMKMTEELLHGLDDVDVIKEDGVVVTESSKAERIPGKVGGFAANLERIYGDTKVIFWVLER